MGEDFSKTSRGEGRRETSQKGPARRSGKTEGSVEQTQKKRSARATKKKRTEDRTAPKRRRAEAAERGEGNGGRRGAGAASRPASRNSFPIVGIGASAGGLTALERLLEEVPATGGMAFVLVTHLSPDRESRLPELLAGYTAMAVEQVSAPTAVRRDRLYVIPPDRYLEIQDGVLVPRRRERGNTPIDVFFRSLAEDQGERAIGVLLTGSGSDGTLGIRAVHSRGGATIVQDPTEAEYPDMPRSAIRTGVVDHVVVLGEVPRLLERYARHLVQGGVRESSPAEETLPDLEAIVSLLRENTGQDFHNYKKRTAFRRTVRRMGLLGIEELPLYLERLRSDPTEVEALVRDLLIGVTQFFRDAKCWAALEEKVIVPLVTAKKAGDTIRVWTVGCATGEEAYSIAMLIHGRLAEVDKRCEVKIFASDIDGQALDLARAGHYPAGIAADVPEDLLSRFFVHDAEMDAYRVSKDLRDSVIFARQNVFSDPPFSRLDLVTCRNLLIYLEPHVQEKVLHLFHFSLHEGGNLFLGSSETVGSQGEYFETVNKKCRIFRARGAEGRGGDVVFPVREAARAAAMAAAGSHPPLVPGRILSRARQRLIDRFGPAAVVVDKNFDIRLFIGSVDEYLTQPTGPPTHRLLDRARRGLLNALRALSKRLAASGGEVEVETRMKTDRGFRPVKILAQPIWDPQTNETLYLVAFRDARESATPVAHPLPAVEVADPGARVQALEEELAVTREELESTVRQLETSNEELQASNEEVGSINEELQSTNEELETSNEELQSLNEELSTVNTKLTEKLEELEARNDDLRNLLGSTDIAIICLNSALRIRWFTPQMGDLLPLRESDVGRPLADFDPRLFDEGLLADARDVVERLSAKEEVVGFEGRRWFLRRAIPYRTADNSIDGVVVTYTDFTERKLVEDDLEEESEELERQVDMRGRHSRLLQRVSMLANEATSTKSALRTALRIMAEENGWEVGHAWLSEVSDSETFVDTGIWHLEEETAVEPFVRASTGSMHVATGLLPAVRESGASFVVRDLTVDERFSRREAALASGLRSVYLCPIMVGAQVEGVLEFLGSRLVEPERRLLEAMTQCGVQLGRVVERHRLEETIRDLEGSERRRLSQELHDSVGQMLTGSAMMAESLRKRSAAGQALDFEDVKALAEAVRNAQEEVRRLSHGLMPIDQREGLTETLETLVLRSETREGPELSFIDESAIEVHDPDVVTHLLRVAQEAIQNAVKHAEAKKVRVALRDEDSKLVLSVEDDGRGLREEDRLQEERGLGLRIMEQRASLIGATLAVESAPEGGTVVTCVYTPRAPSASD